VVDGRRDSVGLSHEVGVDYQQMTQVAQTLLQQQLCAEELRRAPLDLLAADLLPGWDEEWLLIDRERHRQLRMHALEALAVQLTEVGDYGLAIDSAYLALAVEPLCESVNAALIRAYLAEGNRTEALRQYRLFETQLADETGLRPSRQLSDLVAELTRLPRSAERRDFLPHPGSAPPGSSGVPLNRSREGPRGSTQRLTL
jgi:two-component SAPR family response regulator